MGSDDVTDVASNFLGDAHHTLLCLPPLLCVGGGAVVEKVEDHAESPKQTNSHEIRGLSLWSSSVAHKRLASLSKPLRKHHRGTVAHKR